MTQDAKSTNAGRRGLIRACVLATFAGLLLAAVAAHPGDAQARTPKPWTRTVQVRLTAEKLGLPASTSARRLARAALRQSLGGSRLSRSLAGVRLERDLRTPPGPAGGHSVRKPALSADRRGRRVLWSQIDVLIAGAKCDSDPWDGRAGRRGRSAGTAKVSRRSALAVARVAVRGRELARDPQLVAYAGNPGRGRAPRLAWVVETLPAGATRREAPTGLCVVIDAHSGRVLSTWRGNAARSFAPSAARGGPRARSAKVLFEQTIAMNDATRPSPRPPVVPELETGSGYSTWGAHGSAFALANWDAGPGGSDPRRCSSRNWTRRSATSRTWSCTCASRAASARTPGQPAGRGTTAYGSSSG